MKAVILAGGFGTEYRKRPILSLSQWLKLVEGRYFGT